MIKTIELTHQITDAKIIFCYGNEAYKNYVNKRFDVNWEIIGAAVCSEVVDEKTEDYVLVIGLHEHDDDKYQEASLLVHEMNHAVTFLVETYGFECDEFRSYTLQWLYKTIMPKLDKMRNERN